MCRILDAKFQESNLSKIVSYGKHLRSDKQGMLYDVLNKYEFLFSGTLGTCKTKPVDIKIHPGAKPYH